MLNYSVAELRLNILFPSSGDGSSILRGKERSRCGMRTDIGGQREKELNILFPSSGDGSSILRGKERSRCGMRTDIGGQREKELNKP